MPKSTKNYFDSGFFYYFLILEASSKQFIDEENSIDNKDNDPFGQFSFVFRGTHDLLKVFNEKSQSITNSVLRSKEKKRINYNQKFLNLIYRISNDSIKTFRIVDKRNKFFHPDLISYKTTAIIEKKDIIELLDIVKNLLTSL